MVVCIYTLLFKKTFSSILYFTHKRINVSSTFLNKSMKYNLASLKHLYQKDPPDFKSSCSSSALPLGWAERGGSVSSWLRGAWAQKKAWWTYWKYKWQRPIVWWGGCNEIFRGLPKERVPLPYFSYEKCQAWVASWGWVGKRMRTRQH